MACAWCHLRRWSPACTATSPAGLHLVGATLPAGLPPDHLKLLPQVGTAPAGRACCRTTPSCCTGSAPLLLTELLRLVAAARPAELLPDGLRLVATFAAGRLASTSTSPAGLLPDHPELPHLVGTVLPAGLLPDHPELPHQPASGGQSPRCV